MGDKQSYRYRRKEAIAKIIFIGKIFEGPPPPLHTGHNLEDCRIRVFYEQNLFGLLGKV
jgi:hypothetical protein